MSEREIKLIHEAYVLIEDGVVKGTVSRELWDVLMGSLKEWRAAYRAYKLRVERETYGGWRACKGLQQRVFGRWTVLRRVETGNTHHLRFHCRCVCGNEGEVGASDLYNGRSQSCGCLRNEMLIKRGKTVRAAKEAARRERYTRRRKGAICDEGERTVREVTCQSSEVGEDGDMSV